jgi:hypothetical protein
MTTGLTDLRNLEREAFRKFYDDGIFDVYLGVILITMGIAAAITDQMDNEIAGMFITLGLAMGITIPLLLWRRHLLRSRLGDFKPGPERQRKIRGTRLVLLGSVVLGIVAFGVAAAAFNSDTSADTLGAIIPLIWFLNSVGVLGAMAYFLDVPRFYAHGVVVGLAMPLLIWPDVLWDNKIEPWIAFGIPGSTVIAVGIYKLIHFLREYPAPAAGEIADV